MLLLSVMCVLLAAAQNPARAQDIQRSGSNYTLICTNDETSEVVWKNEKEKEKTITETSNSLDVAFNKQTAEGYYTCKHGGRVTHFYFNIKECENCYELSALRAWGVILGDVLVTGGLILIIYYFSTRNSSSSTQKKASNPRSANPPRPPNPDYEALDPKMRSSNALYAGLNK